MKHIKRYTPAILSIMSAGGFIASTILAVKVTPKALYLMDAKKEELESDKLTPMETVKACWKPYIPAMITCGLSIGCLISANILNKKQQASLVSAYALLDQRFKSYRGKVREIYGDIGDQKIREAIINKPEQYEAKDDNILFYDEFSERYFEAPRNKVRNVEYELNKLLHTLGDVSLNEAYELLGLECIQGGDDLGWSEGAGCGWYGYSWIELIQTPVTMSDGLECIMISMPQPPIIDYLEY